MDETKDMELDEANDTELETNEDINAIWADEDDDWKSVEPDDLEPVMPEPVANQPEAEDNKTPETEQEPEQQETTDSETPPETPPESADQRFTLRVLGQTREVGLEEMTALAQKGADYDRLKEKLDGLGDLERTRDALAFVEELANESGLTVPELMDSTRANLLAKREGLDKTVALERVKLQKRERELQNREKNLQEAEERGQRESEAEKKRQDDFKSFLTAFPDVKPSDIPQEVWTAVSGGESLTAAYGRYEGKLLRAENEKLREQVAQLTQNEKNRERAAGSQRSAGQAKPAQDWETAWYGDD